MHYFNVKFADFLSNHLIVYVYIVYLAKLLSELAIFVNLIYSES